MDLSKKIENKVADLLAERILGRFESIETSEKSSQDEQNEEKNLGISIAILQRGWVFVGELYKRGNDCRLENAACIRKWGTSKGLGEIAYGGPTSETVLDKCPTVRFHELTAVALMDCVAEKWSDVI